MKATYIHGPEIDEPLMMNRDNKNYFYHTDGLGSVVGLSNDLGEIEQQYLYTSFGGMTVFNKEGSEIQPTTGIKNPYGYTGREMDSESDLYYYRARYYNPNTGRFMSRDPIGFAGGDTNLYRYVRNNPINLTDPSGLAPGDSFGTEQAAAYDALSYINGISVVESREYAGNIYRNSNGSYSATIPRPGSQAGSNPGPFTNSTTAFYHTHGSEDPGYQNNIFSPQDEGLARNTGLNSYLGTPSEGYKYQSGNTGNQGTLSQPNSCGY